MKNECPPSAAQARTVFGFAKLPAAYATLVMPLLLSILMTFLGGSGLTLFNNVIVQMGTVLAAYLIFNNFIFGPIRKYRRAEAVQKPEPAKKIEPAKAKKPEPSKKPSASKPK